MNINEMATAFKTVAFTWIGVEGAWKGHGGVQKGHEMSGYHFGLGPY